MTNIQQSPQPLIIDSLRKSYGDLTVLDGMSFSVQPGEIYGFVGGNGAGKTTTMRITLGVLASDGGQVHLGDKLVDDSLRRNFGYMPEERGLYPKEKVQQQLVYFARLHGMDKHRAEQRTQDLLERLGLSERANDSVNTLSLGNQQRVQLAAALVHDPQVLVLDEPFSGLDPLAVQVMSDTLKEYAARGVPVVFSSHQLDLVERLCDRVGITRGGKLIAEGTVAELQATGPRSFGVRLEGADESWTAQLTEVDSVHTDSSGQTVIRVRDSAPANVDQLILQAALAAGTVRAFGPINVPLTELYREVVQS